MNNNNLEAELFTLIQFSDILIPHFYEEVSICIEIPKIVCLHINPYGENNYIEYKFCSAKLKEQIVNITNETTDGLYPVHIIAYLFLIYPGETIHVSSKSNKNLGCYTKINFYKIIEKNDFSKFPKMKDVMEMEEFQDYRNEIFSRFKILSVMFGA